MIAGETENMLAKEGHEEYDAFLFFGKKDKKPLTPEEKALRAEKRRNTVNDIGGAFKEGGTASNILGFLGLGKQSSSVPEDYEFGVQPPPVTNPKQGIPTIAIVAGVILIAGIGYVIYQKSKKA